MSHCLVKTIGADGAVYCLNDGNDMFIHPGRFYSLRTNQNRIDSSGLSSPAYAR